MTKKKGVAVSRLEVHLAVTYDVKKPEDISKILKGVLSKIQEVCQVTNVKFMFAEAKGLGDAV